MSSAKPASNLDHCGASVAGPGCTSMASGSMEGSVAPLRGFAFGLMLLHGLLPSRRVPSEPLQPIGVRFEPAQIRLENPPDLKCPQAGLLDEAAVRVQPFHLLPSVQDLLHVPPADPSPSRTACSTTYPLTLMRCLKAQIAGASVPSHRGRAVPEQGLKRFHLSQRNCGTSFDISTFRQRSCSFRELIKRTSKMDQGKGGGWQGRILRTQYMQYFVCDNAPNHFKGRLAWRTPRS